MNIIIQIIKQKIFSERKMNVIQKIIEQRSKTEVNDVDQKMNSVQNRKIFIYNFIKNKLVNVENCKYTVNCWFTVNIFVTPSA